MDNNFFYIKKIPKNITRDWIIKTLNKFINYISSENEKIQDYRHIYRPLNNDKYYLNKIYNTNEINKFSPELVFCEDDVELNDLWMYYRLKVSSCKYTKHPGIHIKILVRDKETQKYVGILSLSSDIFNLESRDKYIGWNNTNKLDGKLQNIINVSTCIGIPPFSFNYNIGKLLIMLVFSNEVNNYIYHKYNKKIAGIITLSLYGKSIQYDRVKELKFIGYSKGYGTVEIPDIIYEILTKYCNSNNIEYKSSNKFYSISNILRKLNISSNLVYHSIERGIYFGYTGTNANKFLVGINNNFKQDYLNSLTNIYDYWKNRWANQRFNNLLETKRLMLKYEFKNIITKQDITKKNVYKFRNKNKEINKTKLTNDEIIEIIKFKHNNSTISNNKTAIIFTEKFNKKVDNKKIKKLYNIC